MTTTSQTEERQQSAEAHLSRLKQQLEEAHIEIGRNKQRLEKLGQIVLEREKKIAELQRYEYSFRKMNEQKQIVDTSGDALKTQLKDLQKENERLSKALEDNQQHAIQLDRANRFLSERQEEAQLEINQFHEELHKAQLLIAELTEKSQCAGGAQQGLEVILRQERLHKDEALEELKTLYSQFETLKSMLAEAKANVEKNKAEREEIEAVHEKLRQEEIEKARTILSETESHLKIAQQHLAKKVKETSDLQDKVHAQELLLQETQNNLDQARLRLSEQQNTFEIQLQQEKRLYEQLSDSAKTAESLVNKWEEKYVTIYEKWKDNEMQLKEMKKLEVKHAQLQVFLANMSGFFETPLKHSSQMLDEPIPKIFESSNYIAQPSLHNVDEINFETSPQQNKNQVVETSNMKKPYQNLFDMPMQSKRLKHNLFE